MTDDTRSIAQDIYDGMDPEDPPEGSQHVETDESGREWLVIIGPRIPGQPRAIFRLSEKDPDPA